MLKQLIVILGLPFCVGGATWIVPGIAARSSSDAAVSTELRILNSGESPVNATIDLLTSDGSAPPAQAVQTIQSGQTLVVPNVLVNLWNLADGTGALRISAGQTLIITARTVRSTAAGSLFSDLPAIPYEQLLPAGSVGHGAWVAQSADPSQGFSSTAGVVLALPQSSVDVVVYDTGGKELNRTTVKGGPGVQEVPLAALVQADLPIARVAFQTRSGRAAAYIILTNNVTGDAAEIIADTAPDVIASTLGPVAHIADANGDVSHTDLRIYNPAAVPNTLTFTLLGATSQDLPATAAVRLAPGEIQEIPDILAKLFNATDAVVATLQVTSTASAAIAAITGKGGLSTVLPLGDYAAPGQSQMILGLKQGSAATVGFAAGPAGGTATLALRDSQGIVLAKADGVRVPFGGLIEQTTDALFPGVTAPDEATLEVAVSSGTLYTYARSVDAGSADTSLQAAAPVVVYDCAPPDISTFTASPNTLTAAGKTTLYWSVTGADTMLITPGGATPAAASGSLPVNLASTTTYTLTATGVCGPTIQTFTVTVGVPALQSVVPAVGQPGQQVALHVGNLPDLTDVTSVTFTFPDATKIVVPVDDTNGSDSLMIAVPLVVTATGSGYRTGAVNISIPNAARPLPFNITAIAYRGDAVKDFGDLLSSIVALNRQTAQMYAQTADGAAFAASLLQTSTQVETWLRKMLSDITASGKATFPIAPPRPTDPNPMTVPVTRADLELYMAVLMNRNGGRLPAAPVTQSFFPRLRPHAGADGPCLDDIPGYTACVNAIGSGEIVRFLIKVLNKAPTDKLPPPWGFIAKGAILTANLENVRCLLRPIVLDSFQAQAQDPPGYVRIISRRQRNSTGVNIFARLRREYQTKEELLNDLYGTPTVGGAYQFYNEWLDKNGAEDPSGRKFLLQPVFVCDLFKVRPSTRPSANDTSNLQGTKPGNAALYPNVETGSKDSLAYLFRGKAPESRAGIAIDTYEGHFVYETGPRPGQSAAHFTKSTTKYAGVNVGGKYLSFNINAQNARFGPVTAIADITDSIEVGADNPVRFAFDLGALGKASYRVQALNDTAWEVQMSASAENNSGFGTTSLLLGGTSENAVSNRPVQSRITYSSQGSVSQYTDFTGHTLTGQMSMTDYASISCNAAGSQSLTLDHSTNAATFAYNPAPIVCDNTSGLNFSTHINGFIGAFQGTARIQIEMDDGSNSQLAWAPPPLPEGPFRRSPVVLAKASGGKSVGRFHLVSRPSIGQPFSNLGN